MATVMVIVADLVIGTGDEFANPEVTGNRPNVVDELPRRLTAHAVGLAIDFQIRIGNHVEEHAAAIAMGGWISGIVVGEMLAAEEIGIALAVKDQLFAVEKDEIDAKLAL